MRKLFNKYSFWFFLLFPFFNPTSLKYIPNLTQVYDIIQIWKLIAISFAVIIYISRRRISMPIALVTCMQVISIFCTLINGIYEMKVFTNALLALGISIITELALKNNFPLFLRVFIKIAFCQLLINFILCLLFPSGLRVASLYTNWTNPLYFIGIDNAMIKEILPVLMMVYYVRLCNGANTTIKSKLTKNTLFLVINFISFVTLCIVKSATGLVSYLLIVIMMWIFSFMLKMKFPYKVICTVYVLFFLLIIIQDSDLEIVGKITGLFGRSTTFTGRTLLWQKALKMITEKPIIGYGYSSGNISVWGGIYSSHNMFLEILLQGGCLLFLSFLLLTFYAINSCRAASVQYFNVIFEGLFTFLLIGLVEVGINPFYYMFIILACNPDTERVSQSICFKI